MFTSDNGRSVLVINIGTIGAGKTFVSQMCLPEAVHIGADYIKESAMLGDYPTMSFPEGAGCDWPSEADYNTAEEYSEAASEAACILHRWSKEVLAEMTPAEIKAEPDCLVYDSTGTDDVEIDGVIKMARAEGWKVIALYTEVKLETSIKRDADRVRTLGEAKCLERFGWVRNSLKVLRPKVDEFVTVPNDEFLAEPSRDALLAKAEMERLAGSGITRWLGEALADFLEAEAEADYLAEAEADFSAELLAL